MAENLKSSPNSGNTHVVGIPKRSIKFRLWDSLKNEIIFEGFHVFGEVTMFNAIGCYAYETKGERASLERYNDFHIMQFTGLKDKNGKDIYEGDLIKYIQHHFNTDMVKEKIKLVQWKYDKWSIYETNAGESDVEVIGNVFQNPELLG